MSRLTKYLLAALSALLLSIPFYEWGSGFLILIGLVPLLFVEDHHFRNRKKLGYWSLLKYVLVTFVLFTLFTVWWVRWAAVVAIIASLFVNTAFMSAPFMLFHYVKRATGPRLGYLSLVVIWVAFEYLFLNVQVNFPWILLGNAFSNNVEVIQWYEVTGTLGGTLWVVIVNILLYSLLKGVIAEWRKISGSAKSSSKSGSSKASSRGSKLARLFSANRNRLSWALGFLLFPILISLIRFHTYEEEERPTEFVVLQPNIDPWGKFLDIPADQQTDELLKLAREYITPETDYVVGPETFLTRSVWHQTMDYHPEVLRIKELVAQHPQVNFVIGAMTFKRYELNDSLSTTAKLVNTGEFYYDSYNSALQIDNTGKIQMYHKSRLVTGAEWMPAFNRIKLMERLAVDLGGITRSHGTQEDRAVFTSPWDQTKIAPVICWESVFGEYVTKYVKDNGANFIVVITNDGWWKDTPGHRQHNRYARLRAIETRRSVARSANTGISSLIDQRGVEQDRLGWWVRDGMRGTLNANDHLTFYVKHGDFVARISAFIGVILMLYAIVRNRLLKAEPEFRTQKKPKK